METYGLTVFTGGHGPARFRAAADLARRAEAAGFGAVWTGELYSRSATVPMAMLGAATERTSARPRGAWTPERWKRPRSGSCRR